MSIAFSHATAHERTTSAGQYELIVRERVFPFTNSLLVISKTKMPKKSPFFMFMREYRKQENQLGKPNKSYKEIIDIISPIWDGMSTNEKQKYKLLALKYPKKPLSIEIEVARLYENTADYEETKKNISIMMNSVANDQELLNKKFILLHINCHVHLPEQFYFPAEISAIEFNLRSGVLRTYYQIVGCSEICPRGFAGQMREYSEAFHQIFCWEKHPDNYEKILIDFVTFLNDGVIELKDLTEGTLDLPYLFTIKSEPGLNIMLIKNSLEQLYTTVFPGCAFKNYKLLFKIGSVERLLLQIKKLMGLHLDTKNIREGMSAYDILDSNFFGTGLGCAYHENRDIAFKCSKARTFQWVSNISLHIHSLNGLNIIPGKHFAIQLKDGSKMMVENEENPLTSQQLHLGLRTLRLNS